MTPTLTSAAKTDAQRILDRAARRILAERLAATTPKSRAKARA